MKVLLQILAGALVAFQVAAIAQEWPLFAAAWLGKGPAVRAAPALSSEQRQGAEQALRHFYALSRHVYVSGADPRFTDRLPASEAVTQELLADVAYLQHAGLSQDPALIRLEVVGARPLDPGRVALDTREYWVVKTLRARDRQPIEAPRSQIVDATYRLALEGKRWRVEAWDLREPSPLPGVDGGGP